MEPDTEILREAAEITEGRSETHGAPEDSFTRIARYWTDYLVNEGYDVDVAEGDVADLLALFKLARSQGGDSNPDDNRDRVGYITFAEAFKMEQDTQPPDEERDVSNEIDELAVEIEQKIEENREILDDLPEYESRRKSNTVQLRKVLEGSLDGVVTNDQ